MNAKETNVVGALLAGSMTALVNRVLVLAGVANLDPADGDGRSDDRGRGQDDDDDT